MSGELVVEESFSRREDRALPTHRAATPMQMLALAVERGMDLETIKELRALQKDFEADVARKAFNEAIAAAKAEIPVITKNREVDFTSAKGRTHYQYEDLAEVARTVDPILAKHGLSYRFRTSSTPNEPVTVACILAHRAGHSEENMLCAGRDESGNKNSIQAIGSTITYLQRMTLKASLGLAASTDDDGRNADGASAGMSEGALADHIAAMDGCASLDELQKAFGVAYKAAEALKDQAAMRAIIRAKDGRKAAFAKRSAA